MVESVVQFISVLAFFECIEVVIEAYVSRVSRRLAKGLCSRIPAWPMTSKVILLNQSSTLMVASPSPWATFSVHTSLSLQRTHVRMKAETKAEVYVPLSPSPQRWESALESEQV